MLGALARTGLYQLIPVEPRTFPWTTFAVNVAGAFILGYVTTRFQERLPPSTWPRPLLGTGFCGALTTFSTFQLELLKLIRDDSFGIAVAYVLASLVAGFM